MASQLGACYGTETPEEWDIFVALAYNSSKQLVQFTENNLFYLFYGRDAILPTDTIVAKKNGQSTIDGDYYKYS